ncbi:ORF6N domain-containing protein [Priestia megaterium]|uniref:ORF6N domain-containing protein n=1 Tax=Priestia megaterium TaxID=1404 RepID=UPI00112EE7E3|nr:ORF6N domain-containing protein [Priestia megaterium]TPF17982.1 hypothetical protein CBE78_01790 [Priestia megaterium]TPF22090.1 hypothetical protein CBE79_04295 [Priestia megaterium]
MKKQDQMEAQLNDSNEMVLIESKTMRDQHVFREDVLLKVKAIPEMPNTLEVTTEMAAEYYGVPINTIKTAISRNRDEFNDYEEIKVLKGKALKEFKSEFQDETLFKGANALTLISRRGLLRLGMLLTESEVARSVRSYLLNVEEASDKEQKMWAVEREISKRERRQLTDAIKDFYQGILKKGFEYSTFSNLVYKVIFDMDAKKMREVYELEKKDLIRDYLTTEDLRKVVKVEKTISALILLGKDYQDIKTEMLSNKEKFQ